MVNHLFLLFSSYFIFQFFPHVNFSHRNFCKLLLFTQQLIFFFKCHISKINVYISLKLYQVTDPPTNGDMRHYMISVWMSLGYRFGCSTPQRKRCGKRFLKHMSYNLSHLCLLQGVGGDVMSHFCRGVMDIRY